MTVPFTTSLDGYAAGGATLLLATLWQSALVAAGAALLVRALPFLRVRHQAQVWTLAFLACALLPLGDLLLLHLTPTRSAASLPQTLAEHGSRLVLASSWSFGILLLSLFCSAVASLRLERATRHLLRLKRSARVLAGDPPALRQSTRPIQVLATRELLTPVAAGFFHPAILLPEALLGALKPDEIDQVLRHERAHLDRRDDWTVLFLRAIRCLLPLNPALFYIERQLSRTRELLCDEAVLAAVPEPRGYASCLTHLAEHALSVSIPPLAPQLVGRSSQLQERVLRILAFHPEHHTLSRRQSYLQAGGMLLSVLAVSLLAASLCKAPALVAFAPPSPENIAAGIRLPAEPAIPPGAAHMVEARALLPREPVPADLRVQRTAKKVAREPVLRAALPMPTRPRPAVERLAEREQVGVSTTPAAADVLVLWTAPGPEPSYSILLLVARPTHSLQQQIEEELFTES